jgi:hypothetical protein
MLGSRASHIGFFGFVRNWVARCWFVFIASRFLNVRFPGILVSNHRFLLGAHASRVEKDAGAHRASARGRELIFRDSGSHRADSFAALDRAGGGRADPRDPSAGYPRQDDRSRAPDTGPLRTTEDTTGVNRVPVAAANAVDFGSPAVCVEDMPFIEALTCLLSAPRARPGPCSCSTLSTAMMMIQRERESCLMVLNSVNMRNCA